MTAALLTSLLLGSVASGASLRAAPEIEKRWNISAEWDLLETWVRASIARCRA